MQTTNSGPAASATSVPATAAGVVTAPADTAIPVVPPPKAPDGFISVQDHTAALEKVRKDEKDKLYADLQAARSQVETLTQKVTALEGENTNLKTTVESTKASVSADGKTIDVAKLVSEVSERAAKSVAQNAQIQIEQLTSKLTEVQGQLNATKVKELRERLIAEAGGPDAIIPELVKGNTEEELKASIAESKGILDRQKARFGVTANPPAAGPTDGVTAPTSIPPVNPAPIDTGSTTLRPLPSQSNGSRVSPNEWKQVREQKLAAAAGRYPTR